MEHAPKYHFVAVQVWTLPTNTVEVPITTGTVTNIGSVYTGFIRVINGNIYRTGEL